MLFQFGIISWESALITEDEKKLFDEAPNATKNEISLGVLSIGILTHLSNRKDGYTISNLAYTISKSTGLSESVCASRVRSLRDARFVSTTRDSRNEDSEKKGSQTKVVITERGERLREILVKKMKGLVDEHS